MITPDPAAQVAAIRAQWESNYWDDRHLHCHKAIATLLARLEAVGGEFAAYVAKHEKCIEEEAERFSESLDQCLDRADQAEAEVTRLRGVLERIERGECHVAGLRPTFYGHASQIAHDALGHNPKQPYYQCKAALTAGPGTEGAR